MEHRDMFMIKNVGKFLYVYLKVQLRHNQSSHEYIILLLMKLM